MKQIPLVPLFLESENFLFAITFIQLRVLKLAQKHSILEQLIYTHVKNQDSQNTFFPFLVFQESQLFHREIMPMFLTC